MRTFIVILFICSVNYAADLNIRIIPDTVYVGSLTTITISVNNLKEGEYPLFSDIEDEPEMYSVVDRILTNHSADYILQIWKVGLITIPSIAINITRYKQDVLYLQSGILEIPVISTINENNLILKDIKPMQELQIMSFSKIILYTSFIIMGISFAIYLWIKRKNNQYKQHHITLYEKSKFQETIYSLQSLELPKNINKQTTEEYYMELSRIYRTFINEEYFIRATEMTSEELEKYFKSINIHHELIKSLAQVNKIADMAKYAGKITGVEQFSRDKEDFIHIIKSFHKFEQTIPM